MTIQIRFLGSLQYDLKQQSFTYQIHTESSIRDIVSELIEKPQFIELRSFFSESLDVKRSLLIFRNDQEISALEGMKTKVKTDDTLSFIPVIHGG